MGTVLLQLFSLSLTPYSTCHGLHYWRCTFIFEGRTGLTARHAAPRVTQCGAAALPRSIINRIAGSLTDAQRCQKSWTVLGNQATAPGSVSVSVSVSVGVGVGVGVGVSALGLRTFDI